MNDGMKRVCLMRGLPGCGKSYTARRLAGNEGVVLKYREYISDELFDAWAEKLGGATRDAHRVPSSTIRHWMSRWRHDLTVADILRIK